jgi:Uma2 family endonuclease
MATTAALMTVEDFLKLPEDDGPVYHELRHGEVIAVSRAVLLHNVILKRLVRLLEAVAPHGSYVDSEFPFRASVQHELRVADVAYVSRERWENVDLHAHFPGAPDLVIEVLSPSNTASEIYDKEQLCLDHGAQEFWVVDLDHRQIKVSTPDGRTIRYRSGEDIPLPLFGGATLAVDPVLA